MTATLDRRDATEELVVLELGCAPGVDYSNDPNGWLAEYLEEYAWSVQRDIWTSVSINRSTAVLSCNNSGKTWLAARIVVWWILTRWRHGVRVVTTAPTAAQVSLLLWQEIRAAYKRAKDLDKPVPGRIIGSPFPQWKIGDVTAAFGRKPADHEQSAMQGVHARYVLAVIDEAGGVAQPIWDAIDKIMTNEDARALVIGNPDDRSAPFGKVTAPGSGWHVIRIDGLRTPNFNRDIVTSGKYPMTEALMRHEGIPFNTEPIPEAIRPNLLHPLWVEERFQRWCGVQPEALERMTPAELGQHVADAAAASQLFTAAVRGDFPEASGHSVIPLGWYRRAVERWHDWNMGDKGNPKLKRKPVPPRATPVGRRIIGVDVATTNGADETAVAPRIGDVVLSVHRYPEGDSHVTASRVLEHTGGTTAVAVVDGIGIGAGVRDVLRNEHGMTAVSFEAYLQSDRRDRYGEFRFLNDRAAAWWRLRELLDPTRGATICLPPDDRLEAELTAPTWWVRSSSKGGVIQIESKDDIRKRLGHSTDSADAVIHAFWVDGSPVNTDHGPGGAIPWAPPPGDRPVTTSPATGGAGMIRYELGDDGGE